MTQPELPLSKEVTAAIGASEVDWLIDQLRGRGWITADELLTSLGQTSTDQAKRRIRALAAAIGGHIASGDKGYKLTLDMTADEFGAFDRRLASQETEMQRRRIEVQRVFFTRTNINRVAVAHAS